KTWRYESFHQAGNSEPVTLVRRNSQLFMQNNQGDGFPIKLNHNAISGWIIQSGEDEKQCFGFHATTKALVLLDSGHRHFDSKQCQVLFCLDPVIKRQVKTVEFDNS